MKEYTDIEQSHELAEILPIESADMHYSKHPIEDYYSPIPIIGKYSEIQNEIPCWSLTALMDAMKFDFNLEKFEFDQSDYFTYSVVFELEQTKIRTHEHENAIDACYEMILKLHEQGYELKY